MALDVVSDYLAKCRFLLLDTVAPYRYADVDLIEALNDGILESRRIRPDLWLPFAALPAYSTNSESTTVAIDQQYRMAFVFYMCGMAQLSDHEDTQDERAQAFLGKFTAHLTAGVPA